jgi:hypothetical protein
MSKTKTPQTDAGRALLADVPHRPWRRAEILSDILDIEAEAEQQGFDRGVNVGAEAWQQDHPAAHD